uniref:Core protein VP7 n=1 Tax=Japanaut virus TaxID=2547358 RepID=A0A482A5M5_9REOV|nr:VP7 [Japanaut virus]
MDALVSRALTVLSSCVTLLENRAQLTAEVMESLGITINRYNAIVGRMVTLRPVTQEQRNEMFFMCLDMVLAALNLNIGQISQDYQQGLGTIGVVATVEIPYNAASANSIVRISAETRTWGPDRQPVGLFYEVPEVVAPCRYVQDQGRQITTRFVSSRMAQVSLAAGAQGNIHARLLPNRGGILRVYFVWRVIRVFSDVTGASVVSPQGIVLRVGGADMRAGTVVAWDGLAPINVANQGQGPGMLHIEILWHMTLDKTFNQCENMAANMFNMYSFKNPLWHGLRAAICQRANLPPIMPPIYVPEDRETVLAVLLISKLGDVFSVLNPNFDIFGVVPVAGAVNRAMALAAYQ